jgi:hypothetical protein
MEQQPADGTLFDLQVDYDSGNRFKESAKWGRFIAIVYFIAIGLFLLGLTFGASNIINALGSTNPMVISLGGFFIAMLFLICAVYVYIAIQLYLFTTLVQEGIDRQDQVTFNKGLKALRNHFMASGIVACVMVVWTIFNTVTKIF